jgi:hypothetical protein
MADSTATSPVTSWLRALALVGSPLALGTALLIYFGWVRATVQAQQLGYDIDTLSLSQQDYLLRSIYVWFFPIVALLLLSLALRAVHRRVMRWLDTRRPGGGRLRLARAAELSWVLWVPLALLAWVLSPTAQDVAVPVALTLSLLGAIYGDAVARGGASPRSRRDVFRNAILIALLACALFWTTERFARAVGHSFATAIKIDPAQLISVIIYSSTDLQLTASSVARTELRGGDPTYKFRYDGLRLLEYSDGSYYLINEEWNDGLGRVVVLTDDETVRFEFHR